MNGIFVGIFIFCSGNKTKQHTPYFNTHLRRNGEGRLDLIYIVYRRYRTKRKNLISDFSSRMRWLVI